MVKNKMRSEKEMFDLILNFAYKNNKIKVVAMNGSRVNKKIKKDILQDYDIVYLVSDYESFVYNLEWLNYFGKILIMQIPDIMDGIDYIKNKKLTFLMQFEDFTRIDLTVMDISLLQNYLKQDTLTEILYDKDNVINENITPSDLMYIVKKPTQKEFFNCVNEFLWVSTYVVKGLWRNELLYANYHIERCLIKELLKMYDWKIGVCTNFTVQTGKCHKYLSKYLDDKQYQMFISCYKLDSIENSFNSLITLFDLFCKIALEISNEFSLEYNKNQATKIKQFIYDIKNLSRE